MMKGSSKEYWNWRFKNEGYIWGTEPSKTAYHVLKRFNERDVSSILVPGAGYGRNTKLFSSKDFEVVGIEISKTAYSLAQKYDPETVFHNEDVLEFTSKRSFDSIYGFNILHLFRESERKRLVNQWYGNLRKGGLIFMVFFSNEEHSYGKGRRVEENTFESKQGRPVHYFTKDDLKNHFKDFQIIETESIEERENHGEKGPHIHNLRYIFARKG